MLHICTIFLLMQIGIKITLVYTEEDREAEYFDDLIISNDDGFQTLKGKLKPQKKVDLKDVVENSIDESNQIIPKLKYPYLYEEDEEEVEENKPKLSFKRTRSKKEVRGFDLTIEEKEKFKIWKGGVIPYYIDIVSFGDKVLRDKIRNHLHMVNSATGISFVELEKPPDDEKERWVFFMNRRGLLGCGDHNVKNFTLQGVQRVVLGYDCMSTRGELAEAVMSILGIPAEHNSPDRDKYIKVQMDNIMPDKKYLFEKLEDRDWLFHDLLYDFNSITHYDVYKYSANGRATIVPTQRYEEFKPGLRYSPSDLRKIKMLYSYIVKKKMMQSSVCEKLFQIGKIETRHRKRIKPRHKPNRYLGIPKVSSASSSSSSSEHHTSVEKEKNKHEKLEGSKESSQKDVKWNEVPDEHHSQEKRSGKKFKLSYNYPDKKQLYLASSLLNLSDYDTEYEENIKLKQLKSKIGQEENQKLFLNIPGRYKKEKKRKTTISSLLLLSDYDSTEDFKREPLKGPIQDPLTLLSDYQTDEGLFKLLKNKPQHSPPR